MAPKSKEQFQEIRQRTTTAIKDAALELFAHHGYHSTTISQIAKAAGVSKGLMYNYFESKEALLHEIIVETVEEGEAMLDGIKERTEDPYEQLVLVVEESIEWITVQLKHWKLLTSLAFQTDALKSLESFLQQKQEKAIEQTLDLFQRLGYENPMQEALFFGAIMDGMMLHYMQMEEKYPIEMMKEHLLKKFKPQTD